MTQKHINMNKIKKTHSFIDKDGKPGSCSVLAPGELFHFSISRKVAENLLNKHQWNLPFDIMTPPFNAEDDDWMGLTFDDLENGKIDKDRTEFEIWLPLPTDEQDDIPEELFRSPSLNK